MTDAQAALAQVREALAAGPTPGPWKKATDWRRAAVIQSTEPFKRVVCTGNQNNDGRFGAEDWSGATWVDADFIAACSPANIAVILAHVEAQAAEIERLTAERDACTRMLSNALKRAADVEAEREELRRQLDPMGEYASADELIATLHAEKAEDDAMKRDAQRYRWLRNEANTARKCDPMVCIYPLDEQDLIDGDRLDVAIDAAMGLTRPAEE